MKQRRLILATLSLPLIMLAAVSLPGLGHKLDALKQYSPEKNRALIKVPGEHRTEIPQGYGDSHSVRDFARALSAGTAPEPKVTLCALKTYDAEWSGTDRAGVYTIEAKENGQVKLVKPLNSAANVVAAVKSGGSMYCISTENNGEKAYFYTLDTDKWSMKGIKSEIAVDDVPSDLTVDSTTGKIYGTVYYEDPETYDYGFIGFGEFSLSGHSFNIRKVLERDVYALASDNKGKVHLMFGTRTGWIEPSTLKWDSGLYGVHNAHYPIGYNTMTYDEATGMLYAIVSEEEMKAGVRSYHTYLVKIDPVSFAYTTIFEFPSHQRYAGLYVLPQTVDKEAPAGVTDLSVSFPSITSLTGTVSFTAPLQSVAGNDLTDNISAIIRIGDTEHVINDVQPGSAVTSPAYTFPYGQQVVKVTTANSVDRGETVGTSIFAGEDIPSAVTDLTLDTDGEHPVISWQAPSTGINGGGIDMDALRYKVVRQPGNVLLSANLSGTRFEDIAYTPALEAISYTVTPRSSAGEGEPASTSKAVLGGEWNVPFTESFDSQDNYDLWTVVNANGGSTWQYSATDKSAQYKYDDDRLPGDDWLISPAIRLEAGKKYTISYNYRGLYNGMKESFEIRLGTSFKPSEMSIPVASHEEIGTGIKRNSQVFSVPSDGKYHLGFHATSPSYQYILEIDDISVDYLHGGAPASAKSMTVIPAERGALSAKVQITLPDTDADGNTLSGNLSLKVSRDGVSLPVYMSDDLAPGSTVSFDDSVDKSGIYAYSATISNLAGTGAENRASAFIGVDVPDAVENLAISENADGKPVLSWTPPSTGRNGGWFDASALRYDVYRYFDRLDLIAAKTSGLTATDVTLDVSGDQKFVSYVVLPYAGDSAGRASESPYMLTGAPYTAPLYEGFAKADMSWYPWISVTDRPIKQGWTLDVTGRQHSCADYDGNGGLATFHSAGESEKGVGSRFESPKISVRSLRNPILRFAMYHSETPQGNETMQPLVSIAGAEYTPLCEPIARTGSRTGWRLYSFELPHNATDADWIRIAFNGVTDGMADIYIDAVAVTERPESPLAIEKITGPSKVAVDNPTMFDIFIVNTDSEPSQPASLSLSCTGESSVSVNVESLSPGERRTIKAPFIFSTKGNLSLYASIGTSSSHCDVTCTDPIIPCITDLKAEREDNHVNLLWNAPSPRGGLTESFESYESWAIDGIGDWTMLDLDLDRTYFINAAALLPQAPDDYPNSTAPKAWQICDADELCINEWPEGTPHSGNKMLMAMSNVNSVNDDWAISPRLNCQAQRISLYAKAFTSANSPAERLQVLYSDTGSDPTCFSPLHSDQYITIGDEWTLLEFDVPEGSVYFALRCVSDGAFALFVDDVSFYDTTVPALELLHYEVMRDGERIATVSAPAYTDEEAPRTKCTYSVQAVYDKAVSACTSISVSESAAVENTLTDNENLSATVYTTTGIKVGNMSDLQQLPAGVYITRSRKILK